LVVAEGNDSAAMYDRASHGIVEASTASSDTRKQWARGTIQGQVQQILEEEATMPVGGVREQHRGTVALVYLPAGSGSGEGEPNQCSVMSGTITVLRPRVRNLAERFESKVLPLFTRPTRGVGSMFPEPYLQGLATGDFDVALRNLLGDGAPLSESSLRRLKVDFEQEYDAWMKRDLSDLAIVYWWAAGLYVKAGIEEHKSALLTIVGALTTGEKIVLACESGKPESKGSWLKLLLDLKHRGLRFPRLTVADGRLGLWAALGEIHPSGEAQGCWSHKIINVLNALPKEVHPKASELLKAMPCAKTRTECERRRDEFVRTYGRTGRKAVDRLVRDWERMVKFYEFPQDHWRHIRTTNLVVSPFASARIRTNASRRYKRVEGAKAIIWKMLRVAEQSWRKLHAPELLPVVASSVTFTDGLVTQSADAESAVNHQSERPAA
jgi:transposase-like protein